MTRLLLLLTPSSNRVYAGNAPGVVAAELAVLAAAGVGAPVRAVEPVRVAGVDYLAVDLDDDRGDRTLTALGQLSASHALFAREGELLRPVELARAELLDDDLLTIPKYPGRTNEQFTRALLNVTLASTSWGDRMGRHRFTVLDPLAGRGTTLSWALALGHDAYGVELERREVEAYTAFLTTWLRRKRLKHTISLDPLRRSGRHVADHLAAALSPDVERWKAGERQHLSLWAADTLETGALLGRRKVDAIVTDAPYGVAHGSTSGGGRDRSPGDLLAQAVPVWASVLRTGGAMGIAWNTHGLSRADLARICVGAGLEVRDEAPYLGLAHRVDAGIHRDVVVAHKG
ncbi:MAG: site-specific DNA-methyltransferase [Actinomycetota bacterium]|nr:site-specific DNA-methyltransferase [Actinomycetota bacterium]